MPGTSAGPSRANSRGSSGQLPYGAARASVATSDRGRAAWHQRGRSSTEGVRPDQGSGSLLSFKAAWRRGPPTPSGAATWTVLSTDRRYPALNRKNEAVVELTCSLKTPTSHLRWKVDQYPKPALPAVDRQDPSGNQAVEAIGFSGRLGGGERREPSGLSYSCGVPVYPIPGSRNTQCGGNDSEDETLELARLRDLMSKTNCPGIRGQSRSSESVQWSDSPSLVNGDMRPAPRGTRVERLSRLGELSSRLTSSFMTGSSI